MDHPDFLPIPEDILEEIRKLFPNFTEAEPCAARICKKSPAKKPRLVTPEPPTRQPQKIFVKVSPVKRVRRIVSTGAPTIADFDVEQFVAALFDDGREK